MVCVLHHHWCFNVSYPVKMSGKMSHGFWNNPPTSPPHCLNHTHPIVFFGSTIKMTIGGIIHQGKGEGFCTLLCWQQTKSMLQLTLGRDQCEAQCWGSGSGSRRAKITHKNIKKLINFLFESLDVLYWGLKALPVEKEKFIFQLYFFPISGHRHQNLDPDPNSLEMLDPDPEPQHWRMFKEPKISYLALSVYQYQLMDAAERGIMGRDCCYIHMWQWNYSLLRVHNSTIYTNQPPSLKWKGPRWPVLYSSLDTL